MMQIGQHFLILSGGIATGKTFFATEVAKKIVDNDNGKIHFFQFHEGYSYENFVHGVQIRTQDQCLRYEKGGQPIQEIIELCQKDRKKNHVIVIDDINRCNINAVLGDVLTALESSEVGNVIKTDKGDLKIPENLFMIATMNPLIGKEVIDYAWFRRFTMVELKAEEKYFEIKDEYQYLKEYEDYLIYAGEIFRHIKMLFDLYFSDSVKTREKERYIIGPGIFLQYDYKKIFSENFKALHARLKYIIAPLVDEYIKQGILTESAQIDSDVIKDIWGEFLNLPKNNPNKGAYLKCEPGKSERVYKKIDELMSYSEIPSNALFFFLLHSADQYLQIIFAKRKFCCLIEQDKQCAERPVIEYVNAGKQSSRNLYTKEKKITIDGAEYRWFSGTAHSSMEIRNRDNKIVSGQNTADILDVLLENIDAKIEYLKKVYEWLEK